MDWQRDPKVILGGIKRKFGSKSVAVRSSAINEGTVEHSMAGTFESLLNVSAL